MINDQHLTDCLRNAMLDYYRLVYRFQQQKTRVYLQRQGRGLTRHEYLKGILFSLAQDEELMPLPEYYFAPPSKKRIDMIWTNWNGDEVAAFEIDQTIYPKSIKKLCYLDQSCRKYILSAGIGRKPLQHDLLDDTDIVCIDVTMRTLGVYEHFYSL